MQGQWVASEKERRHSKEGVRSRERIDGKCAPCVVAGEQSQVGLVLCPCLSVAVASGRVQLHAAKPRKISAVAGALELAGRDFFCTTAALVNVL